MIKWDKTKLVSHFGAHTCKREEERKKRRERRGRRKRRAKVWNSLDTCMDFYGFVWISMDFWNFVWVLDYSISRVWLGIHHNPRLVESWVGKTLVCIR